MDTTIIWILLLYGYYYYMDTVITVYCRLILLQYQHLLLVCYCLVCRETMSKDNNQQYRVVSNNKHKCPPSIINNSVIV